MNIIDSHLPARLHKVERPARISLKRQLLALLRTDFLRLGMLATACVGLTLVITHLHEPPSPLANETKQARMERPADAEASNNIGNSSNSAKTLRAIDLTEFQRLINSEGTIVLDARPEIFHRLGHVPGSRSLSRSEFEQDYTKQRSFLESRRDKLIVVYCSSAGCEDSQMVANALVKLGFQHVMIFREGWDAWIQAGLPEEK